MISKELEKAIFSVNAYENGGTAPTENDTLAFRRLVHEGMSLVQMQDMYYGTLDMIRRMGYDQRTVSACGSVMSAAWDQVGDWRC